MEGNIYYIRAHDGKINGKDGHEYYFSRNDLKNCVISDLHEGDSVEFSVLIDNGRRRAIKLRKLGGQQSVKNRNTRPGINPAVKLDNFTEQERSIIHKLAEVFYVTNSGDELKVGRSEYKYCFVKPTEDFTEQFNLQREIVVVFSDYANFEPRSLDAAGMIIEKQKSALRLERACNILMSSDQNIESTLRDILKNDLNMQVVIPFSYQEFSRENWDKNSIINRFRAFFFDRDLFDQATPIEKDQFFFGRRDYVQSLVNRARHGEHSGVFGLRRSGKTSVLFAIERALERLGEHCIFFDCQNFHLNRWNELLFQIIKQVSEHYNKTINRKEDDYTEKNAQVLFHQDMNVLLKGESRLTLLFDEIEHITFDIAKTEHWKNGGDYSLYWQTLRSYYQTYSDKLSLIIAGTNPMINETPIVNGYDNPMFQQLTNNTYLPAFDFAHTREMVNKLGGYMGLKFEDDVCALLNTDFGGHPFLIRSICSAINRYITEKNFTKPIKIEKTIYTHVKGEYIKTEADKFCQQILYVLEHNYQTEFLSLKRLALDGKDDNIDSTVISHLIGYNIISENNGLYDFKIEIVKQYLKKKFPYQTIPETREERLTEIMNRRDRCERGLRKLIKTQLLAAYSKEDAKTNVIAALRDKRKSEELSYDELFDANKNELYFSDLIKIIGNNWDCFKNIFERDQRYVGSTLNIINALRCDSHAKDVSDSDFAQFRASIGWLEEVLQDFIA